MNPHPENLPSAGPAGERFPAKSPHPGHQDGGQAADYDRWVDDPDTADALARARKYPFEQPSRSYLYSPSGSIPIGRDAIPGADATSPVFHGRIPVLAYASNASPDALARKFPEPDDTRVPVTACRLAGFEVVYSRHFSRGYIPATLVVAPETTLLTWITWLDPAQIETMDRTEHLGVNYELKPLENGVAVLESGLQIERPLTYRGLHGCLERGGEPIAVAGLRATGRRWTALDQDGILELARLAIAPRLTLAEMLADVIGAPPGSDRYTAALRRAVL